MRATHLKGDLEDQAKTTLGRLNDIKPTLLGGLTKKINVIDCASLFSIIEQPCFTLVQGKYCRRTVPLKQDFSIVSAVVMQVCYKKLKILVQ